MAFVYMLLLKLYVFLLISDLPNIINVSILRDAAMNDGSLIGVPDLLGLVNEPTGHFDMHFGFKFRRLHHPLRFFFDIRQCVDGSVVNSALCGFLGNVSSGVNPWHGAVAVLKLDSIHGESYVDLEEEDLKDILAYFALRIDV